MILRKKLGLFLLVMGLAGAAGAVRAEEYAVVEDFDERPVPIKAYPPAYPPAMLREGVTGLVSVAAVIDETGKVVERTVSKSTRSEFDRAALDAVGKWKFKPAAKKGTPVAVRIVIPIQFSLQD